MIAMAQYSASKEDFETINCFLDFLEIREGPINGLVNHKKFEVACENFKERRSQVLGKI